MMQAGTEAFKQTVSLKKRIRNILQGYPEGTPVIKELIQNAEDAGATEVCRAKICVFVWMHA